MSRKHERTDLVTVRGLTNLWFLAFMVVVVRICFRVIHRIRCSPGPNERRRRKQWYRSNDCQVTSATDKQDKQFINNSVLNDRKRMP